MRLASLAGFCGRCKSVIVLAPLLAQTSKIMSNKNGSPTNGEKGNEMPVYNEFLTLAIDKIAPKVDSFSKSVTRMKNAREKVEKALPDIGILYCAMQTRYKRGVALDASNPGHIPVSKKFGTWFRENTNTDTNGKALAAAKAFRVFVLGGKLTEQQYKEIGNASIQTLSRVAGVVEKANGSELTSEQIAANENLRQATEIATSVSDTKGKDLRQFASELTGRKKPTDETSTQHAFDAVGIKSFVEECKKQGAFDVLAAEVIEAFAETKVAPTTAENGLRVGRGLIDAVSEVASPGRHQSLGQCHRQGACASGRGASRNQQHCASKINDVRALTGRTTTVVRRVSVFIHSPGNEVR